MPKPPPDKAGRSRARGSSSRRSSKARAHRNAQRRQRSVVQVAALAVALGIAIALLFGLNLVGQVAQPVGTASGFYTPKVAVIGVVDRTAPTEVDQRVLGANDAQVGAVLTGGACPASGWATLSAGRTATVDCAPPVTDDGVVENWRDRQAEAARSGATLGTLADSGAQCVSAVGPGAAIGAARGDGTNADYATVDTFVAGDYTSNCALTLIDAGDRSDAIIEELANRPDWTVVVVGIGGSHDAQLVYRLGTTLPGWLLSESTQRQGVVTLPDVSWTVQPLVAGGDTANPPRPENPADPGVGSPLQVEENSGVSLPRLTAHLTQVERLVTPPIGAIIVLLGVATAVTLIALVMWRQGRPAAPALLAILAAGLPLALQVAGAIGWWRTSSADASLLGTVLLAWAGVAGAAWYARRRGRSTATVLAVATFVVFAGDAALDGWWHRNSLLALRPMRSFHGFDGPAWTVLSLAALAVLAIVTRPWWARALARTRDAPDEEQPTSRKRRRPPAPLPYDIMWRPLVAVAVTAGAVLGLVWAWHPPTGPDVISGIGTAVWMAASGWWLVRTDRRDRGLVG
ncbi:hypothetical protein [Microlunatus sp. Y2014]|uniref:hypothetical protein n=1 Tax=Microlunatus sp. Y2014 TaxID=3418488 RepID=UPI003DA76DF9